MTGKNPDMNWPAVGSPAKNRVRSPMTTVPSGLVYVPAWNQKKVFRNWCRPIGMSSRLANPKMPAPHAPRSMSSLANAVSPSPTGSHSSPKATPRSVQRNAIRIGTRRRPLKKPSQSTSLVRWKRCQTTAVSSPIRMPPSTPGFCGMPSGRSLVTEPPTGKAARTPW